MRHRRKGALAPLLRIGLIALVAIGGSLWKQAELRRSDEATGIDLDHLAPPLVMTGDFTSPPEQRRIQTEDGAQTSEKQVADAISGNSLFQHSYRWSRGPDWVNLVAPGSDRRHHFANAYLVGYVPYAKVAPWVPLYALARKKTYQFDHEQYAGSQELWQTSREAFSTPRGDCEDHAIALADWLIGLGLDARVAIGKAGGSGHAWVVVLDERQDYLLEATDKNLRPRRSLPLAALNTDYQPEAMFNRDSFWVNTGPCLTNTYRGKAWQWRSRYRDDAEAVPDTGERASSSRGS